MSSKEATSRSDALLPSGICEYGDGAIASERLLGQLREGSPENPLIIAAFDFDGTCINGSSPKKLVRKLGFGMRLSLYKLFRIGLWGLAYKLNLPKDAEGVRSRVFSAFAGKPAKSVNKFLGEFYQTEIDPLYREDADASMVAHLEEGHAVILVSASFEPIIAAAMTEHPIQIAMASRMKIDADGNYTRDVEGRPTEGDDKIVALRKFADDRFGKGCWRIGWAYGDHYSDLALLEEAEHPCAVTPDGKLRRTAEKRGWAVLDWK